MAKLSAQEILNKVSERITDEDLAIELMEDISDSMAVSNEDEKNALESKIAELESNISELKSKYRERFLNGNVEDEVEEPKEDEIVDIKEI